MLGILALEGSRRHLAVAGIFGALVLVSCAVPAPSPASSPLVAGEIDRSIPIRLANGLRADRPWIESVLSDPRSVERLDIRVSSDEAQQLDERAVTQAIEFRKAVGLEADDAWVRHLQHDPSALVRYGIPVSVDEAAAMDRRARTEAELAPAVEAYGQAHPEDFGGSYITPGGGTVVAQFSRNVDKHAAALLALVAPESVQLQVRSVRWSSRELDERNKAIWSPAGRAWFKGLGVRVRGGGSHVQDNLVHLELAIPTDDPTLAARVVEHFDGAGWLRVDVAVVPAMNLPLGSLEIVVVDRAGRRVADVWCQLLPSVAGAGGDDTIHDSGPSGVCTWNAIHATSYDIEIWRRIGEGLIGRGRVEVGASGRTRVQVVVDNQ